MTEDSRTNRLAEFLQFISDARTFLSKYHVSKNHGAVSRIRNEVEEKYLDEKGRPSAYQKFESTLYEDAPDIVTLWIFFQKYEHDQLRRYHKLVGMELGGLTGDRHPMAILSRSVFGTAALLLSSITVWWGFIQLVSADGRGNFVSEILQNLLSPAAINRLTGVIGLVGVFVLVWYVARMLRNRKQVGFLSSLSRSLQLYLDTADHPNFNNHPLPADPEP